MHRALQLVIFAAVGTAAAANQTTTMMPNGTDPLYENLAARFREDYADRYQNSSPALQRIPEGEWYGWDYNFFVNGPSFANMGGLSKFTYALSMDGQTVTSTPTMQSTGTHHWRLREGWPPYPDGSVRREWVVHPDPKNFQCLDAWWDGPTLRVHGWECDKANFNQMWLIEYDSDLLWKTVFIRPRHSPEYCLTVNGLTSSYNNPYAVVLDKCTWRVEQQQIWAVIQTEPTG
ncbi:hypothetical protein SPRG_08250 [Saprolegnia parasitica CBS 223.65]|uniref:Uncharacterized protein n=1 Tax=Saprolegnia parasitica (strain CBS 223.65) TaxID=695850 RepID=A0A067CI06_SAPPC|nr:hypothetical protein SPRG_08250 [Saprolegnia parasitica CBS 223.65]KDO26447.1 hypothetical protein SPRG_08250 [Saprolegnia parasitica CBS 223.65]|eukprot:XP_012202883.1 hypothetical protein SPRG_08250 [Saprolegnia parasitica CBS 223.65]